LEDDMSHQRPPHDPRSRFEDEGIPDLQDSTPGRQWAVDPQEAPVPGDEPIGVDDYGTTHDERIQGEPLADRLEREVPEEQPTFGDTDSLGDTDSEADGGVEPAWEAQPEEPSGQVWDEPRPAGRLVAPDEGARADVEPDEVATEVGPDAGGYSAEEAAMRVEPE